MSTGGSRRPYWLSELRLIWRRRHVAHNLFSSKLKTVNFKVEQRVVFQLVIMQ
jgi:hypothetical protein